MKLWHKFIHPVTNYFRRQRGELLQSIFPDVAAWCICDLGGSKHFWEKLAIKGLPLSHVTIYNISANETQISRPAEEAHDAIEVVIYDGKKIPVADDQFDLLVCNSVLEHVPPEQRAKLVAEMRRVARHIFIQTPAHSFPLEPHFIMPFVHWLPRRVGYWLIHVSPWRLLSRPTAETIADYWWNTRLLTMRELKILFPNEAIRRERIFGITKSYYVIS